MACLRAHVLCVFTCLCAHVLDVLTCLRVCVLTCLACFRVYVRACYDEMFYFLTRLRTWCAFLSYLLYISILKFKNSHSQKLWVLLRWSYFLFTFWYQLKQCQFFTIYIFTYYINFCWTHCFCLIYCQSSYWFLLLSDNIPW